MSNFVESMAQLRDGILKKRPLVHHVTNYVTAGFCADMALTIGASPVMADEITELPEMTAKADALVINLGTLNSVKIEAMYKAAEVAREHNIPIVLDPVGVMATTLRLKVARELLSKGVSIIRGNLSECTALLENKAEGKGVDSTVEGVKSLSAVAYRLAQEYNCTVAITGAIDVISNGKETVMAYNGDPMLGNITGAGCMTTTLIGAAAGATDNYLEAAVFGITTMNLGGQNAAKISRGPGGFRVNLLDEIYNLTAYDIATYFKGEIL